jgi:Uncharacterised protein family (UPF0236)
MDRGELSETIVHEVSALFAAEVRAAGPALLAADLDGMEQRVQQLSRRVCGALLERVLAVRAQAPAARPPCPACGGLLRLVEQARGRHVQGLTGDVTLRRPTYVCTRPECGQGYAPLDAQLGLGAATLTPRLARVACRAGITAAFEDAAAHLEEALGVDLSGETVRRVSEALGAVAEAAQQAAIAQAQQGQLPRPVHGAPEVVVAVDGCQVPLDDGWHEMKVGRVAPVGPALRHDVRSGRTFLAWGPSVCCAGLESAEDFWYRVYVTACRGGLSQQTRRVVVLGDGAAWIWTRAAHFVGGPGVEVVEIVDIYHAYEHLWTVGRALGDTPEAISAWVEPLKDALYTQGAPTVLAALAALVPPDAAAAKVVETARAYFADNAARMDYPRFVAQQLPIGSGAVESLCKSLIEARLKHAGMRWTPAGAQTIATLRALSLSGAWEAFWAGHPLRTWLRQCPPTRPRRHAAPVLSPAAAPPTALLPAMAPVSPAPPTPPPAPAVAPGTVPPRRPAATHPWRHAPIGRARCA